ncbi:MAG: acyl-CoA thioesterase, partial [Spirochaetaceae bacterium]
MKGMKMSDYQYEIEMSVRDYELDLEGIVNNAVYLNYFEHARHEFLKAVGLDFSELHKQGTDAVVTRIEVDYRRFLSSGDRFIIKCGLSRKGKLRLIFQQDLFKLPDNTLAAQAVVTAT